MDGKAESAATAGAVTIERRESIALLQFSAPSRVNALSVPVMRDLIAACRTFEDDARTAAIVIAGRDTIFSAGLDLRSDETRAMAEGGLEERRALADTGRRLLQALADLAPVTVAAVEGPCLGGGLALAAALDFRVAARSAVFGAPRLASASAWGGGSLAHLPLSQACRWRAASCLRRAPDGLRGARGRARGSSRGGWPSLPASLELLQRAGELARGAAPDGQAGPRRHGDGERHRRRSRHRSARGVRLVR